MKFGGHGKKISPWSRVFELMVTTLPFLNNIFENENGNTYYESVQVQAIFGGFMVVYTFFGKKGHYHFGGDFRGP